MTTISGQLLIGDDNKLSMKIPLSPANPELVDVPLDELLEEFIGKQVHIDILPIEPRMNKGGK